MKILFLISGLGWFRGTQRMFYESIRLFKDHGHEVLVWGYGESGETANRIEALNVKVLKGMDAMPEAVSFRPDIVNIHRGGWHSDLETRILDILKKGGAKVVETSVFGRVDEKSQGLIDLSIQISRWDLYRWNRWKGQLAVPGIYVPYIVDTDQFVPRDIHATTCFRKRYDIPEHAFVIGRAGKTLWANLARPMLAILDRFESAYFLTVEDYNSPPPPEVSSHPRVRLIPRLFANDDLSLFYSACSVIVSASWIGESFGMVIAEAMSCGTPVVAISTPDCDNAQAEVVRHGVGGLLAASSDTIAEAIAMLIENPSLLNSLSANARNLIVSRYSRPVVGGMLVIAFEALLGTNPIETLRQNGFVFDIPKREISASISDVIGSYKLATHLFRLQNLTRFWRVMYKTYDMVRNRITGHPPSML